MTTFNYNNTIDNCNYRIRICNYSEETPKIMIWEPHEFSEKATIITKIFDLSLEEYTELKKLYFGNHWLSYDEKQYLIALGVAEHDIEAQS